MDTIYGDAHPMGDTQPMCDDMTVMGMHGPCVMTNVTGTTNVTGMHGLSSSHDSLYANTRP